MIGGGREYDGEYDDDVEEEGEEGGDWRLYQYTCYGDMLVLGR